MNTRSSSRAWPAFVLLATLGSTVPALAQAGHDFGRSRVKIPERSDEGDWNGTWYYTNREERVALWIRTVDGTPQLKFQYFGGIKREQFKTDWDSKATYFSVGNPGSYEFRPVERDANTIRARLTWRLEVGSSSRTDEGDITMFRSGDGRRLAMVYEEGFERRIENAGRTRVEPRHQVWSFTKASRRLVLWDELPF